MALLHIVLRNGGRISFCLQKVSFLFAETKNFVRDLHGLLNLLTSPWQSMVTYLCFLKFFFKCDLNFWSNMKRIYHFGLDVVRNYNYCNLASLSFGLLCRPYTFSYEL